MVGQNIGKYRVLDRVGRGGMGTVYRALDETLHREVAIKVLNADLNDEAVAKRFRAEAVTVARLNHPGIATVYELFQHDGQWLMVMEFLRGETLEALVSRKGALPVTQSAGLCMQALSALAHAHSLGVVHRDLKPANMILSDTGVLKVMDFGIARVAGTEHLTSAGFMMGTPAYMAPEQVVAGDIDARADLYAIGVVLFHLATAKLPFKGKTPFEMAQSRLYGAPTPIRDLRPDAPEWLGRVLEIALTRDPEGRYHSAPLFHEALRRGVAELPLDTPYAGALPPELVVTAAPNTLRTLASPPVDPSTAMTIAPESMAAMAAATAVTMPPTPRRRLPMVPVAAAAVVIAAIVVWLIQRATPAPGPDSAPTTPAATATSLPPAPEHALPPTSPAAPASAPTQTPATTSTTAPPGVTGVQTPAPPPAAAGPEAAARGRGATKPLGVDPLASFPGVRAIVIAGKKGEERDAELRFAAGEITVVDTRAATPIVVLRYRDLVRAIYTRARAPRWDKSFAAPPADLDLPGGGIFRSARHWLVLQSNTTFAIVRLNDGDWRAIIERVTERTGLRVDQSAGTP
ncbi:MAG TPA: serine/threonine-protein kinase [Vicinamibacterales bacterium]|nr:serine/threonine-protein kinase [Vicinamibacterales bacterium]